MSFVYHGRTKGEGCGHVKSICLSVIFLLTLPRRCLCRDLLYLLLYVFVAFGNSHQPAVSRSIISYRNSLVNKFYRRNHQPSCPQQSQVSVFKQRSKVTEKSNQSSRSKDFQSPQSSPESDFSCQSEWISHISENSISYKNRSYKTSSSEEKTPYEVRELLSSLVPQKRSIFFIQIRF